MSAGWWVGLGVAVRLSGFAGVVSVGRSFGGPALSVAFLVQPFGRARIFLLLPCLRRGVLLLWVGWCGG